MAKLPFLMSADLHGQVDQYRALLSVAELEGVKAVLVAGDLVDAMSVPEYEAIWREQLFPLLEEFAPRTGPLLVAMGNHDFAGALPVVESRPDLVRVVHERPHPLGEGFLLVGYPYTAPTPWWTKDFEKWDVEKPPPRPLGRCGQRSRGRDLVPFCLDELGPTETLVHDLARLATVTDPGRTAYLLHQPPADTPLDVLWGGSHIGSQAVRRFLEERQPYLTLHGHIHETVDQSGEFRARFGRALACSAGNTPRQREVGVIGGDLCDLSTLRRRLVRAG